MKWLVYSNLPQDNGVRIHKVNYTPALTHTDANKLYFESLSIKISLFLSFF
jgi:hypothetical protein